ncbi:MAG: helix-turn-helix domain-containing protein [Spirochaetaceae bacterium]|nr:MAG: helix-turn-helix domain-containing protein [Spirochaetaceae bacterium]
MSLTLIPIFILALTSYFVFYRSMKTQSDDFDRLILSTLSEKIDRELEEIKEILFRYSLFMDIDQENYGRLLGVVRELGGIAGTNDFVEDIFIYIIDSGQVLTQNGLYYADVFFDKVYRYAGRTGLMFQQRLHEQNNFYILSTTEVIQDSFINNRYLTIMNSVPLREDPRANLVVLVDEASLHAPFHATGLASRADQIAIVNTSLELIAGSIDETLDQGVLRELLAETETEKLSAAHGDRLGSSYVFHSRSSVTDWHYLVFTPVNQITKQAASIRNITIWICAVLVIVSFLLTWIISMNLYSPIREIVATIRNSPVSEQERAVKTDEMSYILNHVKYVMERNKSLDAGMKQVEPAFRDHYLRSLILGIPNRMISDSDTGVKLDWPHANFAVLVVQISFLGDTVPPEYSRESMTDDVLRYLEEVLNSAEGMVGVITYIGKSQMTILVNLDTEQTLGVLLREVESQIKRYSEKYRCSIAMGIGGFCRTMSQINGSYEEALKALHGRIIGAKYQIIHFNNMGKAQTSKPRLNYPIERERQLIYKVLAGNHEKVVEEINGIIANNLFEEITYNHLISLFDQFIATAGKVLNKDKSIKLESEEKEFLHHYRYNKPENLAAMRRSVLDIYERITDAFSQKKNTKGEGLKEKLVRYIQDNYPAPDLSLDRIAAEFDLNPKYVSRYFKEQTGTNYLDYLNMIRIKQAKELLMKNDKLKILEISKMVGFYNVNTFIAVFKRIEGVTPNAFRKLSRA